MAEPRGTYVPASIARLGHHDRQARPPRQGSSYGLLLWVLSSSYFCI
uniref:Sad1/unc-84-like protein 2 n=1 Tax=Schistosoma japonicum TaxID=6182 RepID=C1LDQ1_SCHJA|nr:Sad1/unc-84-like protein 2 [Schistosoma japonicum]